MQILTKSWKQPEIRDCCRGYRNRKEFKKKDTVANSLGGTAGIFFN